MHNGNKWGGEVGPAGSFTHHQEGGPLRGGTVELEPGGDKSQLFPREEWARREKPCRHPKHHSATTPEMRGPPV